MLSLFDLEILQAIKKLEYKKIYELRLRINRPLKILYDNKWGYLSSKGFSFSANCSFIINKTTISSVLVRATECSMYSATDTIAKGYISLSSGCRIGVCGEVVYFDNKIKAIKNFTSLVIRTPHSIENAGLSYINYIHYDNKINNTLIISPPGGGKTTILRSLAKMLSDDYNVLVIDERQEIAGANDGLFSFDINDCDVISGGVKSDIISNSIRSCSPQIIITDEISEDDYNSIRFAISCGVNIITSIHSSGIENLLKKPNFEKFFSDKIFDLYIVLEGRKNPGKCAGVYDVNFARL